MGENDPNIISAAYNALQQNGGIDVSNLIVIGIPSNAGGAPTATNLWDTTNYEAIPPLIEACLADITSGNDGIINTQYGGFIPLRPQFFACATAAPRSMRRTQVWAQAISDLEQF